MTVKRLPENTQPQDKIIIEFTSKLLSIPTLQKLRDSCVSQGMVAGSAITKVVDDHIKLVYLAQTIVKLYDLGDEKGVREGIETLKLIL